MPTHNELLLPEWQAIRQLTYNYLDTLDTENLTLKLPFPESQSIGYQFWCMIGAHESYMEQLKHGEWQGFSCSLKTLKDVAPGTIKGHMQDGDKAFETLLQTVDLGQPLKDGRLGYSVVMQMIKHEMHHHGQLINLMFCHHLPIPPSWEAEWSLRY